MEEEKQHKPYRIMEGDIVTLTRQDADKDGKHYTFYKVATKNTVDDTQTYYKQLSFPSGTDLKDGCRIKIINMTEYARHLDKYRDTYYLFINEYEELGENSTEAIKEYNKELKENEDMVF